MRSAFGCLAAALALLGCADGGGRSGDGGRMDGAIIRLDAGLGDAGGLVCPTGQHACGAGCIDDLANMPSVGCRLGCGEPCPTPPDGAAMCLDTGRCSFGCPPPFTEVGGECVCAPMTCDTLGWECGAPDDGCGRALDCGVSAVGTCHEGSCSCGADINEPNGDAGSATRLPDFGDFPETFHTVNDGGIESLDDEDWYVVDVSDDLNGGDPDVDMVLSDVPPGATYVLTAEFVCEGGGHDSDCDGSPASLGLGGVGCEITVNGGSDGFMNLYQQCDPVDDSGTLYVRVRASSHDGTCAPYTLDFHVY